MKFNELLELYRAEVLPQMMEFWNDLSDDVKAQLTRLNHFFCGLHGLVHMAEIANTSLIEVERNYFDGDVPIENPHFRRATESGICRLIRTACQAFAYGGDQKNGCHGRFVIYLADYLKQHSVHSLPLTPYRGNRFNIVFHNAAVVYWLHKEMRQFLETDGSNKWVLHDLKVSFFIAGTKALGLICKMITTPLWVLIESKDVSIMDMNSKYLHLITFLEDAAKNTEDFINGNLILFPDIPLKEDSTYKALLETSEYDGDCCIILAVVLPAIAKVAQKLYKDHLPGGIYAGMESSEDMQEATSSVAKHNKFCETIFGYYDILLTCKPHISTLSAEAAIMFSFNKTSDWLAAKTKEEEIQLMKDSYKDVPRVRASFKNRQKRLKKEKFQKQKEKHLKTEEAKKKKLQDRVNETNDIIFWGLMQSEEDVDTALAKLKGGEKVQGLKAQLKFRKNVLKQITSDPKLFNLTVQVGDSKKRRPLTVEELKANVVSLIQEVSQEKDQLAPDVPLLVGHRVDHKFVDDQGIETWHKGTVISQVRIFHQHLFKECRLHFTVNILTAHPVELLSCSLEPLKVIYKQIYIQLIVLSMVNLYYTNTCMCYYLLLVIKLYTFVVTNNFDIFVIITCLPFACFYSES